jgi:hypothetical protein
MQENTIIWLLLGFCDVGKLKMPDNVNIFDPSFLWELWKGATIGIMIISDSMSVSHVVTKVAYYAMEGKETLQDLKSKNFLFLSLMTAPKSLGSFLHNNCLWNWKKICPGENKDYGFQMFPLGIVCIRFPSCRLFIL